MSVLLKSITVSTLLLCIAAAALVAADNRSVPLQETAAFLAGGALPAGSALLPLTRTAQYRHYRRNMQAKWKRYRSRVVVPLTAWVKRWMPVRKNSTLFYPFAGGDYINARLFYPEADTVVMIGLESAGMIPRLQSLSRRQLLRGLGLLNEGFRVFHKWNFYRTLGMRKFMERSPLRGTVPHMLIQMHWLAMRPVRAYGLKVTADGKLLQTPAQSGRYYRHMAIDCLDSSGRSKRVIYLQLDLRNLSLERNPGWVAWLASLGRTDCLMKAASYLLPRPPYSRISEIIIGMADTLVQTDSCMPYRRLVNGWNITLFGRYQRAHYIFPSFSQPLLYRAYRRARYRKLDFPVSYERPGNRRNLQLCVPKRNSRRRTD